MIKDIKLQKIMTKSVISFAELCGVNAISVGRAMVLGACTGCSVTPPPLLVQFRSCRQRNKGSRPATRSRRCRWQ